jgi:hypothetical protein
VVFPTRVGVEEEAGLRVRYAGHAAPVADAAALQPQQQGAGSEGVFGVRVVEEPPQPGDGGEDGLGVLVGGPPENVNKLSLPRL